MTKCYDLPDCDCGPTDSYWFEYCPLHEAAPDLFRALRALLSNHPPAHTQPDKGMGSLGYNLRVAEAVCRKAQE